MSNFVSPIPNPQLTITSGGTYATNQGLLQDSVGNLYYVTMAQLGSANPTLEPSLIIYKSADGGNSWNTIVSDSDRGSDEGFGVSMGADDILYMCIVNTTYAPNSNLGMYRYNTATNVFLADDYLGPTPGGGVLADFLAQSQPLADGTITIAFTSAVAGVSYDKVQFTTWKAGVWGAPIDAADGTNRLNPQWLLKEATGDRVHLFLYEGDPGGSGSFGIWQVSLESNGTVNTLQNLVVATVNLTITGGPLGKPCIFGADTQIECPYVFGLGNGANPSTTSVRVLRGTVAANPVWTDEQAVAANAIAGTDVEPFLNLGYFATSTVQQGTGITIVFSVNNNEQPGAGNNIRSLLYTTTTSALVAGWGTATKLFTAPFPSATSSIYTATLSGVGSSIGTIIGSIAVTGEQVHYTDLSLFFIGAGAAPVLRKCLQPL